MTHIETDILIIGAGGAGMSAAIAAARDPQKAAGVLAELMGGKAVPFPPNPGSFFALQLDEHGSGVEVYPAGTELQPGGATGGNFVRKDARGYGSTHFALSVATDAGTVQSIAQRAGWHCFDCNRGPFHVIEVWVENETMVEILPRVCAGVSRLHEARQRHGGHGGGPHRGGPPPANLNRPGCGASQ